MKTVLVYELIMHSILSIQTNLARLKYLQEDIVA